MPAGKPLDGFYTCRFPGSEVLGLMVALPPDVPSPMPFAIETDIGYIMACLIVLTWDAPVPFAIPSARGRDAEGRRLWRTEDRWTPDDLEEGAEFLGPLGGERS